MENPQAFPRLIAQQEGMSIRDYFAAKAMQGIVSNDNYLDAIFKKGNQKMSEGSMLALVAYDLADAMLMERSKDGR